MTVLFIVLVSGGITLSGCTKQEEGFNEAVAPEPLSDPMPGEEKAG